MNGFIVPVSVGEYADKLTILQIKADKFVGEARNKVRKELAELLKCGSAEIKHRLQQCIEYSELKLVNKVLWILEDKIRRYEYEQNFGDNFILCARAVYYWNDKRARLKDKISVLYSSGILEQKQYNKYPISNEIFDLTFLDKMLGDFNFNQNS